MIVSKVLMQGNNRRLKLVATLLQLSCVVSEALNHTAQRVHCT